MKGSFFWGLKLGLKLWAWYWLMTAIRVLLGKAIQKSPAPIDHEHLQRWIRSVKEKVLNFVLFLASFLDPNRDA